MTLRQNLKQVFALLPEGLQGRLEYRLRPSLSEGFGAFNGQQARIAIFQRLLAACDIGQIVETGTFRATTTALFAATCLPVHSVEVSKKFYEYARLKLGAAGNVTLYHGDSVARLPEICDRLANAPRTTFVYLDSHWRDRLPLRDEIEILSRRLPNAVVMIDDFAVPFDAGYAFDDYGDGARIGVDYLVRARTPQPFSLYFPAVPSQQETGRRRGTCVVALTPELARTLDGIDLLRFHGTSDRLSGGGT